MAYDKRREANVPLGTERVQPSTKLKLKLTKSAQCLPGLPIAGVAHRGQYFVHTIRVSRNLPSLSSSMFPLKILSALVALLLIASVRAETNVTIDDTDSRIVYRPSWSFQADVRLSPFSGTRKYSPVRQTDNTQDRFNKTTHFTSKQGATGSLTFSVEYRFLPQGPDGP